MRCLCAATVLAVTSALWVSSLSAQRYLPIGGARPSLQLEVTKPFVSQDGPFAGASFTSSGWDASVVYPLVGGPTLFGRMGLMYASIEGLDGSLTLANPRIGAMIGSSEGKRAELHVDLPLAKELGEGYSTGIGLFSGYEELERFALDTWAVGATASAQMEPGPDAFIGVRGGMSALVHTSGGADAYAILSFFGDAPTDRTRFRFEFSSHTLMTDSALSLSDRSTFFAGLDVVWPFSRFSPALFVRAPIDDTLDGTVPVVAGLRLSFGR